MSQNSFYYPTKKHQIFSNTNSAKEDKRYPTTTLNDASWTVDVTRTPIRALHNPIVARSDCVYFGPFFIAIILSENLKNKSIKIFF